MRKLTLIAAAGALAIGGAGIAVAKHHGSAKGGWDMARADANGDGLITLDEAKAHGAERFAKMDANNDGSISRADREARAQQRFIESDSNGDGELTPAEMTAAREKREAERAERRAQKGEKKELYKSVGRVAPWKNDDDKGLLFDTEGKVEDERPTIDLLKHHDVLDGWFLGMLNKREGLLW